MTDQHWTAFSGHHCIAAGLREAVAQAVKRTHDEDGEITVIIIDDATGRQIDLDLRGSADDVIRRLSSDSKSSNPPAKRRAGRPRLGVTAREVTLLPRHWEWLAQQPGGASGTLRRLVDAARVSPDARRRHAQTVADRFMAVMAGDQAHYEDASRALYAGDAARFELLIAQWPRDVRGHAMRLAREAFEVQDPGTSEPAARFDGRA